jgi:hypothetical protein
MGELCFVGGSVLGAALAWLIGRSDRSRWTAATLTGVSCGLLGALASISGGTMAPMAQAGIGLLSAAAPLTLCVISVNTAAATKSTSFAIGRYSATLVLVLVYGTGCATAGFVAAAGLRQLSHDSSVSDCCS